MRALPHQLLTSHGHAQVEALVIGMVYGLVAPRAVILHSILHECLVGNQELQRLLGREDLQCQTWVLAVMLATGQASGSGGNSGHPSGAQSCGHVLCI